MKPCPFCGSSRQFEDFVPNTGCNVMFMRCQDCHAQGPWSTRSKSAQEQWEMIRAEATQADKLLREFIDGPRNDPFAFNERGWLARVVEYLERGTSARS